MNEITSITPQIKDKNRCNIFIDGRFYCGMLLETVVKNRLKTGLTVSPEKLSQMQLESEKNTALDKALTHISATRKTEKQVRDFLQGKGYLTDVCDYVVEKMRGYGFLNDKEYADAYVEYASRKKGKKLIRLELKSKGIDEKEIDEAVGAIDEEEQVCSASALLQKYLKNKEVSREILQKAFRYLYAKGFETDVVKEALSKYGDCEEE